MFQLTNLTKTYIKKATISNNVLQFVTKQEQLQAIHDGVLWTTAC